MSEIEPVQNKGCKQEVNIHWNVSTYGLPGSSMIVLYADRVPNVYLYSGYASSPIVAGPF